MGVRYGKRNRLESLPGMPMETLVALGRNNIKYEIYDEQLIADKVNANLAAQQERIDSQ